MLLLLELLRRLPVGRGEEPINAVVNVPILLLLVVLVIEQIMVGVVERVLIGRRLLRLIITLYLCV